MGCFILLFKNRGDRLIPTYDYKCSNCGYQFEKFQQMSDSVLKKCPECKKLKLNRLIGAGGGLIFKGSGFYQTDYGRDKNYDSDKKIGEGKIKKGPADKKELERKNKK